MSPSLASGIASMLAARLLPALFSFAVHVAMARLAGVEALGAYTSLLAVFTIFQALTSAGLQLYVSREVALDRTAASRLLGQGRTFGLISGFAGAGVFVAYAAAAVPPERFVAGALLGLALVPSTWVALQEAVLIGMGAHHLVAVAAIVENLGKTALAALALSMTLGLEGVCAAIALSRSGGLVVGALLLRSVGVTASSLSALEGAWAFAHALAPFSAAFILAMTYFRIDVPLVQLVAGESVTGVYAVAATLFGALILLPDSALSASYPRLVALRHVSREAFVRGTWTAARAMSFAMAFVAILVITTADAIIDRVYGVPFAGAAPVLRTMVLALPVHALNGALGQALQGSGHQSSMVGVVWSGLLLHVVLAPVLTMAVGIQGSAVSMLASSALVSVGALRAVHSRLGAISVGLPVAIELGALVGPLLLVTLVPPQWRWPASGIALLGCAGGALWSGAVGGVRGLGRVAA